MVDLIDWRLLVVLLIVLGARFVNQDEPLMDVACDCVPDVPTVTVEPITNAPACPVGKITFKTRTIPLQHPLSGNTMFNNMTVKAIFDHPPILHRFVNVSTVELRREILMRINWTSDVWISKVNEMFKENRLSGKWVLFTLVNQGMLELTVNFIASLERTGFKKFVIMCYDAATYTFLAELGYLDNVAMVPTSWLQREISNVYLKFKQKEYYDLMNSRLLVHLELFNLGHHLFLSDVDVVFLSPHIVDYISFEDEGINADLWYMVDTTHDALNGGFWFAKPTKNTKEFMRLSYHYATTRQKLKLDQTAMAHVLNNDMKSFFMSDKARPLSKALFPSGLFVGPWYRSNQKFQLYPMVVHANWLSGVSDKKNFLKQQKMWYVGDMFANSSQTLTMGA